MIEIELDKEIIGNQLADELGIDRMAVRLNGTTLYIDMPESKKSAVLKIYEKHIPINTTKIKEELRAQVLAKLAALGITEDEAKAFLG